QDPDPKCTIDRKGLPACNFNNQKCYVERNDVTPAWVHQKKPSNGPVKPYKKGYVYLDPVRSNGRPVKLLGKISSGRKAICVDFYYATIGNSSVPINILIQEGTEYKLAHQVLAKTSGEWESSSFSCCLPGQTETTLAIEATSTADGIPAIDDMDVRSSNMPCENGKLVCYPSLPDQMPLDPATAPRCRYDVISSTSKDDATLLSEIGDDVVSFCLEIQFAIPDIREDLRNVLSVFIVTENSTEWGQSYNYYRKDRTVWKRNSFEGFLPEGKNRKLQIVAKKEGLQIDYINIRTSTLKPTPPPFQTTTKSLEKESEDLAIIFTCPKNHTYLFITPPLCRMMAVPPLEPNSDQGWREVESDNIVKTTFPGKSFYLLYKVTDQTVNNNSASLTTETMQIYNRSTISFSYALSGNATLEVLAKDEEQQEVLVWSTEEQTARDWRTFEGPLGKTGSVQVTFKIIPASRDPAATPLLVALTDILIKVFPQEEYPRKQTTSALYMHPMTSDGDMSYPVDERSTASPPGPGSILQWTEVVTDYDTADIFQFPVSGQDLSYEGTEVTLSNDLPRLTTKTIQKHNRSVISFRYSLFGNVRLEVIAKYDKQREVLVWTSDKETNLEWKVFEGPPETTREVQVIYKFYPREKPTGRYLWFTIKDYPNQWDIDYHNRHTVEEDGVVDTNIMEDDNTKDEDDVTDTNIMDDNETNDEDDVKNNTNDDDEVDNKEERKAFTALMSDWAFVLLVFGLAIIVCALFAALICCGIFKYCFVNAAVSPSSVI
ncbi:hypothetical protein ElyMa_004771800, partial [Elysia marginata]